MDSIAEESMDSIDEEDDADPEPEDSADDGAELLDIDDEDDGAAVSDEATLLALEAVVAVSLPQAPSRARPAAVAAMMVARLENAVLENMVKPFFGSGHAVAHLVVGTMGGAGNCGWCRTARMGTGCYSTVKTVES
jgi:hypothetical protein